MYGLMDARKLAYFFTVADALAQCQLLELQLKCQVGSALALKEKKPLAPIPFRLTAVEVEKAKERHQKGRHLSSWPATSKN